MIKPGEAIIYDTPPKLIQLRWEYLVREVPRIAMETAGQDTLEAAMNNPPREGYTFYRFLRRYSRASGAPLTIIYRRLRTEEN